MEEITREEAAQNKTKFYIIVIILLLILFALLLLGFSFFKIKYSVESSKVEKGAGEEVRVLDDTGELSKPAGEFLDVVDWRELAKVLPDNVNGYQSSPVEGFTLVEEGYKTSRVIKNYTKGDRSVSITVFDTAQTKKHLEYTKSFYEVDSSYMYAKKIEIGGYPAQEQYLYAPKMGTTYVLVKDRFFVIVQGTIDSLSELRVFAERVDYATLGSF